MLGAPGTQAAAATMVFHKAALKRHFPYCVTMILIKLLDGDATIALITVPLGLYLAFTKEMCIVNEFYWQTKERAKHGRKDRTAH